MEYSECYSAVQELLNRASEEFDSRFSILPRTYDWLEAFCEKVDDFCETIDCTSVDADVDVKNMVLTIHILCDDVIFKNGRANEFCWLAADAASFSISKKAEDVMQLSFMVTGLWTKN